MSIIGTGSDVSLFNRIGISPVPGASTPGTGCTPVTPAPGDPFGLVTEYTTDATLTHPDGATYADIYLVGGGGGGTVGVAEGQIGAAILRASTVGDDTGYSISLSADGTIMAIGSPTFSGYTALTLPVEGMARVFQYDGSAWVQLGADILGGAIDLDSGFSVALSSDGTILAVGIPEFSGSVNSGFVKLYEFDGASWNQLGNTIANAPGTQHHCGSAVSLSSDGLTIVVLSAYSVPSPGFASVYRYDGISTWVQLGSNIGSDANFNLNAGVDISSDGETVLLNLSVVALPIILDILEVYRYDGAGWIQLGSAIVRGTGQGSAAAITQDGATIVGGFPGTNEVVVYTYSGSTWNQVGPAIASTAESADISVSSDGTTFIVASTIANGIKVNKFDGVVWNEIFTISTGSQPNYGNASSSTKLAANGTIVSRGLDTVFQARAYQISIDASGGRKGQEKPVRILADSSVPVSFTIGAGGERVIGGNGGDTVLTVGADTVVVPGGTTGYHTTVGEPGIYNGYGAGGSISSNYGGSIKAIAGNGAQGAVIVSYS